MATGHPIIWRPDNKATRFVVSKMPKVPNGIRKAPINHHGKMSGYRLAGVRLMGLRPACRHLGLKDPGLS